jgi:hypothetical protein
MRTPTAFRVEVDKIGQRVLAGKTDQEAALDLLVRWASGDRPDLIPDLMRDVFRDWARGKLNEWLGKRSKEVGQPTADLQMMIELFGDVPTRIEVGPNRFVNLLDANRAQLHAWQRQARVKADNVTGYAERVDRLIAWLDPQLADDQMTTRTALAMAVAG